MRVIEDPACRWVAAPGWLRCRDLGGMTMTLSRYDCEEQEPRRPVRGPRSEPQFVSNGAPGVAGCHGASCFRPKSRL